MNCPDLQTFTHCINNKSESWENQAWSPSHHFTNKSEPNVTTIKLFSMETMKKTVWRSCVLRGAMHSG